MAIRNLGTFRNTVNARSGRCLRGMFIPSLCTSLGGGVQECDIYTSAWASAYFVYSVGFPKTSNADKYGYRFPRFFFYMLLNLHELTNSGSGESAGIKETNR